MEPLSPGIPKLHLLVRPSQDDPQRVRDAPLSARQPHRPAPSGVVGPQTARSMTAKIQSSRVFDSTVEFIDSPVLPPVRPNGTPNNNANANGATRRKDEDAEFRVLHPSLDLSDETGELSRLMLDKWSVHAGEAEFASVSLFCEMKLSEAKRMAAWVEAPNRFFVVACCQLLDKFIARLGGSGGGSRFPGGGSGGGGGEQGVHGAAFLHKILAELVTAIFLPAPGLGYEDRVPYFIEYKRLRKSSTQLMAAMASREKAMSTRQRLPDKIDKLMTRWKTTTNRRLLGHIFRGWVTAMSAQRDIRGLKCRVFQSLRKANLGSLFRAWRIEALRKAYQRESVEYQTMLSITASSLSRKDIVINESEAKISSMARIIDSLTESNKQLSARIEQLERLVATGGREEDSSTVPDETVSRVIEPRRPEVQFDRIDSLITQEDERMDRLNRMLLETMFGMARMVEASAIQMAKDVMDSLEYQLDGSVLQNLAEMIQTENALGAKVETATAGTSGSFSRRPRLVTIRDLAQMPIDALLLYWFRWHLQLSSSVEKAADRTIKNFTTDLTDGRRFSFLLHRLFPTFFDLSMAHEIDTDQRLRNIATFHSRVQPELPQVVTSDSIHAGSATENVAFVAMLFGASIGSVRKINLEKQRGDFLNIITSWRRVRSLLLEVKRMNDNYDALMLAHLLKEMRTCETLFKQLNSELSAIAIASNEASSALSQVAYKILGITWSCVRTRGIMLPVSPSEAAAIDLIDERWLERVREFTTIDVGVVRELLVHEMAVEFRAAQLQGKTQRRMSATSVVLTPPVIPERDVLAHTEALRRVLHVYSKDLHDIFKHYSASGGLGSVATMSLSEYSKFIKDCFGSDRCIKPAVADAIYKASIRLTTPEPTGMPSVTEVAPAETAVGEPTESDDGREMAGSEFVEAIVRIAAAKSVSSKVPPADKFRELMENQVLPHALRSQSEIFRAEVAAPKVREVFARHKPELQRVFRYYASMHSLREHQSTLTLKEFAVLAKDCKLVGTFITEHTLKQVLANLQHEVEPGTEDDLRANFDDFQEALAAITEYVVCNPYVPLCKRIEQFINEMLLPRARQKKKPGGDAL